MPSLFRHLALLFCVCLSLLAKDEWLPISEEEKVSKNSTLIPEAPAEILFRRISIDESDAPNERIVHEYIRYKIYSIDKAAPYTRLSKLFSDSNGSNSTIKLSARLILPDGTVKLFGKESIQERVVNESAAEKTFLRRMLGSGSPVLKEKFLAISGIEAGCILEYQVDVSASIFKSISLYLLQSPDLPTRRAELLCKYKDTNKFFYRCSVINNKIGNSQMEAPKGKSYVKVSATDLPPLPREPLSGSTGDYALTLMSCYDPVEMQVIPRHEQHSYNVDLAKDGPWSPVAMRMYGMQEDRAYPTRRLRQITTELLAGATTPLEKAQRIHRFVLRLHQEYRQGPERKPFVPQTREDLVGPVRDIDVLLDYAKHPDAPRINAEEYLWLAMAMYKCAGLECRGLLLADRRLIRFYPSLVSQLLLPNPAAAVKIGEDWMVSMPYLATPLPFGSLPWYCEGQPALWSKVGPQEFLNIPAAPADFTLVGNAARLQLHSDGSLEGTCKRVYTGHAAEAMRAMVTKKTNPKALFSRLLNSDFRKLALAGKAAQEEKDEDAEEKEDKSVSKGSRNPVTITQVKGLSDPEQRIEVDYKLYLPNFAVTAGTRLVIKPSLFRSEANALFSSSTRVTNIQFPYRLQELDDVIITLPADLEPEGLEQPSSLKADAQMFRNQLSYDEAKHSIKLRREFDSQLLVAKPTAYSAIKTFYDEMGRADRQELLLKRIESATGATPGATPAEPATPAPTTPSETAPDNKEEPAPEPPTEQSGEPTPPKS